MEPVPISIQSLMIQKFRKFQGQSVEFTHPITLITGQNGTAKSTLLGMLAQPFSFGSKKEVNKRDNSVYIGNYHALRLADYVDIAGNFFTYPCDKIFRLSKLHDTPDKLYLYETKLSGINFAEEKDSPLATKKLLTVRQTRAGKLRFVTGPGAQESISHKSGEGNFPHPVIYLSLGRLRPLAEVKTCKISSGQGKLAADESQWYERAYAEIFSLVDEKPTSGLMDTKEKKRSVVPLTNDYDGESCSAGQDNLGRILTALLSFRRLKRQLGVRYRGALLLIDEIDATLHPASQVRLMQLLYREAQELTLQVVATTHSLYLVEYCTRTLQKDVGIIHVKELAGALEVNSDASMDDIIADLKNVAIPPPKRKNRLKVSVVFEDAEAVRLFKYLIKKSPDLKGRLSIANIQRKGSSDKASHMSGEYLKIFANNASKIPELQRIVFVPDGDMEWAKNPKSKNVVPLPGCKPIEVQIFDMLKALPADDAFWSRCAGQNYHKKVAIGNNNLLDASNIQDVKKWYQQQKPFWGRGLAIVFEQYYTINKQECDHFLRLFKKTVGRCESNG